MSTALRAPRCRASVLRHPPSFCSSQLIFRDIHLPRQRRITRRGASEERPGHPDRLRSIPSCRGCNAAVASAYSLSALSETRRTNGEFGHFFYDHKTAATGPPGLQPLRIDSKYSMLPASVLARGQSHPHGLSHAPNHDPYIHPSHSLGPMLPTFSPTPCKLADLRSAPLSWHTRVTRRGRMWWRTNPPWARKFAHTTTLSGRLRAWGGTAVF